MPMRPKALLVILTLALSACQSVGQSVGWQLLQVGTSPPPLADGRAVYDPTTGSAILFGGITSDNRLSDQTWEWKENSWLQILPDSQPKARAKQAMAYDPARKKIVLFGGWDGKSVFDDTWEWNGKDWKQIKPKHKPAARCCHAMAYDSHSKKVILYGGWDSAQGVFYNDVWSWDGKDWKEMDSRGLPLMSGHTMEWFPEQNEIVSVSSTRSVNTWVFNEEQWTDLGINPNPTRSEGRSAYDSSKNLIVYFGGIKDGQFQNDTWVFDGENWQLLKLNSAPSARFGHVMFYDPTRKAVILFGGIQSNTLYNDTWALGLPDDISTLILPTPIKTSTP